MVVAEMVWTLESFYGLPKDEVAEKIGKILNTPNLHCEPSASVLEALALPGSRLQLRHKGRYST